MSTGTRRGFIRPSSSFVTSSKSLNNRPRCWLEACAASRYCRARASIVAVCGFSANPKYPSIEATGVRISWLAVEINSLCSSSSASSFVMSRKVIILSACGPPVGVSVSAIASLCCPCIATSTYSRSVTA